MTYLIVIVCLVAGFLAGIIYSERKQAKTWKPYILSAYKQGREAGRRKR